MHLYTITRGIKNLVDNLINDLQAQYYPYKLDGKDMTLQLAVRPIQLWELVMPDECLQSVMKMLWDGQENMTSRFNLPLGVIRKVLGAQKVPKLDEKIAQRIVRKENVAIYPVGIKPDEFKVVKNEQI